MMDKVYNGIVSLVAEWKISQKNTQTSIYFVGVSGPCDIWGNFIKACKKNNDGCPPNDCLPACSKKSNLIAHSTGTSNGQQTMGTRTIPLPKIVSFADIPFNDYSYTDHIYCGHICAVYIFGNHDISMH